MRSVCPAARRWSVGEGEELCIEEVARLGGGGGGDRRSTGIQSITMGREGALGSEGAFVFTPISATRHGETDLTPKAQVMHKNRAHYPRRLIRGPNPKKSGGEVVKIYDSI